METTIRLIIRISSVEKGGLVRERFRTEPHVDILFRLKAEESRALGVSGSQP